MLAAVLTANPHNPMDGTLVAVKKLKGEAWPLTCASTSVAIALADASNVLDPLNEALRMINFQHAHVLSLLGVSFDECRVPHLIMPFMHHGDLRKYLQREASNRVR